MEEEVPLSRRQEIRIGQWEEAETQEYSDGSRMDGAAAAGTTKDAQYLGCHATVMDAEMLGIHMTLKAGHTKITLDSQRAISRAVQLYTKPARPWMELQIQKDCQADSAMIWVKEHSGIKGNKAADRRANLRAYGGRVMQEEERITPAGIR